MRLVKCYGLIGRLLPPPLLLAPLLPLLPDELLPELEGGGEL